MEWVLYIASDVAVGSDVLVWLMPL